MAQRFYCEVMGQLLGPLEATDLKRMARAGEITPVDKIRQGDDGRWVEAGKVKGLFDVQASTSESRALEPKVLEPKLPEPKPRPPAPRPIATVEKRSVVTPELQRANDNGISSWIGPAQPLVSQPLTGTSSQGASVVPYAPAAMTVDAQPIALAAESDYPCPFCGESIKRVAKKCRHCGEFLDPTLRAAQSPAQPFVLTQSAAPATTVNVSNVVQVGVPTVKRWSPLVAVLLSFFIPGLGQIYKGQVISGIVWFVMVFIGYMAFVVPGAVLHLCCIAGASMGDPYR